MKHTDTLKPYKSGSKFSYTSGAYATIELLKTRPELVKEVYIHSAYSGKHILVKKCGDARIPVVFNDNAFRSVNQKENSYVMAVFDKYECPLNPGKPHIVLVNPSDMGNLGTVIRAMAGFGFTELAIITPAADILHPKTIRASMGAVFHIKHALFETFAEYRDAYAGHTCYPFMLDGGELPGVLQAAWTPLFSLIFGNEAEGLDSVFALEGRAVRIPQSPLVDSLNISVAVGIGAYEFAKRYGLV